MKLIIEFLATCDEGERNNEYEANRWVGTIALFGEFVELSSCIMRSEARQCSLGNAVLSPARHSLQVHNGIEHLRPGLTLLL